MATLLILQGPNPGRVYPLGDGRSLIGRAPEAAVVLESLAVSRHHAHVSFIDGTYFVEDAGSSNGTFVNGKRVAGRLPISERDTLQVGPYLLVLRPDAPPPPTTPDPVVRTQVGVTTTNRNLFAQNPAHKLRVVMEITRNLARTLDLDTLLGKLLDQLMRLFPQADRGLIILCEDDRLVVRARVARNGDGEDGSFSQTLVRRALADGVGLLSEDVRRDPTIDKTATLLALDLRSLLCVPLIASDEQRLGVIQLDANRPGAPFLPDDLELLTAVSLQVAVVLDNAALHAQRLREERLLQELALAREIQQGFLPTDFRPTEGAGYELFAQVAPAREVSGDLYDFFPLADGRLAFFVGDVSGKGMPAALFMMPVRTLCHHLASASTTPAETLRRLNAALVADNPTSMYVTLAHGTYDPRTGAVLLASGGHPQPLLRRADGRAEVVQVPRGRVLGYDLDNPGLADARLTLGRGETLVLYSDGYTEAFAPDRKDMFGPDRLREALGGPRAVLPLADCAAAVRDEIERFTGGPEQQDDQTLLLLRRK